MNEYIVNRIKRFISPEIQNLINNKDIQFQNEFDANDLLEYAASVGNLSLCKLAHNEWKADNIEMMLIAGAYFGHEHICRQAYEWGARYLNGMIAFAAKGQHQSLIDLAIKWGCTDYTLMFLLTERVIENRLNVFNTLAMDLGRYHNSVFLINRFNQTYAKQLSTAPLDGHYERNSSAKSLHYLATELSRTVVTAPNFIRQQNLDKVFAYLKYSAALRFVKRWKIRSLDEFMLLAIIKNDENLFTLAHEWKGASRITNEVALDLSREKYIVQEIITTTESANSLLMIATQLNNEHICRFAHDRGATCFDKMLHIAIMEQNIPFCELARSWGANDPNNYSFMLACEMFNIEMMRYVYSWQIPSQERWNDELTFFAINGKVDLCRLLINEMKTSNPGNTIINVGDTLLSLAVMYDHEELIKVSIDEFGANDLTTALCFAAHNNNESICQLLREYGATDYERMIEVAIQNNFVSILILAINWGVTQEILNRALLVATTCRNKPLCKVIKNAGANNFNEMLSKASVKGEIKLFILALKWGATNAKKEGLQSSRFLIQKIAQELPE